MRAACPEERRRSLQRDQHLRREQLPDTGDGDRPYLVVGQLQLQPVAFIAEICAGLVRTEGTAPAVEAPTLAGTDRSRPGYEFAIGEDQPCGTGVGRHSDQR